MATLPQISSSASAPNNAPAPASQAHVRPPKVLARGPFFARLPALRTMTAVVAGAGAQSQAEGIQVTEYDPNNIAGVRMNPLVPPPITLPDRVGTTRILLSDTQACVQKLSARMDILGARSEQALKEVQLARETLVTGGEKTVAEIADVVYKSQAANMKRFDSLDKLHDRLAQHTTSIDALSKVNEAQAASYNLLMQTMHGIANAQQAIQTQHAQLLSTLTPLDPLVRSIPTHVDALKPSLERAIERAVDHALTRLRVQNDQERLRSTPRAQKRKRAFEDDVAVGDAARIRHRSMVAPSSYAQPIGEPSSPLLYRQRSGTWNTGRLQSLRSRGSMRDALSEVAPSAVMGATNKVSTPEPRAQAPVHTAIRQMTRRPTITIPNVRSMTLSAHKRPRSRSTVQTTAAIGDAIAVTADDPVEVNEDATSTSSITVVTNDVLAPARIARSATKATTTLVPNVTSSCVSLGTPPAALASADTGPEGNVKSITSHASESEAPDVGSGNVEHSPVENPNPTEQSGVKTKSNSSKSKNKAKAPTRNKGSGTGKRKGKKTAVDLGLDTNTGSSSTVSDKALKKPVEKKSNRAKPDPKSKSKSKAISKESSPKRTTTGESDVSLKSLVSVHGPPNSPSTHTKSSPIVSDESNTSNLSSGGVPLQPLAPVVSNTIPNTTSLLSLMDASQESFSLTARGSGHGVEGNGNGPDLSAALAHIDRDINFFSDLGVQEDQDEEKEREPETRNTYNSTNYFARMEEPSPATSTLTRGRPRRFLVVDNDSAEIDLLDELFAE